jgi:translation initiation factor 2 alpha subunit (eIF-2alpha)
MNNLEIGDLVLCTVDRIIGTAVFVKIDRRNIEGEIVMSEVAPGRIRNIRDYVVPKKKIVCKVLRISSAGNIELSLRRVTLKEKKEVLEREQQEKSYTSILKSVLGEKSEKAVQEMQKEDTLFSFFDEAKTKPENLEKIVGKEDAKKILEILNTQKKKKVIIKKEIHLTTIKPEGITLIKKVLEIFKGITVKYLSAGRYSLELESEDVKTADKKLREMIVIAEKEAKKSGIEFSVK